MIKRARFTAHTVFISVLPALPGLNSYSNPERRDPFLLRAKERELESETSGDEKPREIHFIRGEKDCEEKNPSRIAAQVPECAVPVKAIKPPRRNAKVGR